MTRWFIDLLYGSIPARFESVFSLEESIARLSLATKRLSSEALTDHVAVGSVSVQGVELEHCHSLHTPFRPFFFGTFSQVDGKVVLSGKFTMQPLVKTFFSIWFGGVGLLTGLCWLGLGVQKMVGDRPVQFSYGVLTVQSGPWYLGLLPVAMFSAGVALVSLGKWFTRNDVTWLSQVITKALSGGEELRRTAIKAES